MCTHFYLKIIKLHLVFVCDSAFYTTDLKFYMRKCFIIQLFAVYSCILLLKINDVVPLLHASNIFLEMKTSVLEMNLLIAIFSQPDDYFYLMAGIYPDKIDEHFNLKSTFLLHVCVNVSIVVFRLTL